MAAQKIHASTQKFTEIIDFIDNLVIMEGGNACIVIELTASNFSLLSRREQDARIYSYAELLNSLSFPIQILIRNKRLDISSYLADLDEAADTTPNKQLAEHIRSYRSFIREIVTLNVVLSKSFYITIPYSSLEAGAKGVTQLQKGQTQAQALANLAKKPLMLKAESILGQIQKFAATAKILDREELIKLFYGIYNEDAKIETKELDETIETPIITQGGIE